MLARALLLAASILAGCTSAAPTEDASAQGPEMEFQVFPPAAQFGDTPRLIVRNTGTVPLEYRDRDFLLETLYEGVWRTVHAPGDPNSRCDSPSASLVVHPGRTESQRLVVCGLRNRPAALFPGRYRMTQTALTIPAEPEEDAVELEEVVELRVAESTAGVPGPADCRVLCVSDTHVERGDVVRVSFTPPRRFTWGLDWTLHAGDTETIWPLAFLVGGLRDRELRTAWAGEPVGWNDIGFRGRGVWRWEVPDRMTPGVYSIVKDGFAGGSLPIEDRTTIWTVSFEVEG